MLGLIHPVLSPSHITWGDRAKVLLAAKIACFSNRAVTMRLPHDFQENEAADRPHSTCMCNVTMA